ncbi:hypothetical protein C5E11_15840 [Clavibacter michiganensis]|nr:hypothetical protein C5E11_15840 [Clavibacter michiganensis]
MRFRLPPAESVGDVAVDDAALVVVHSSPARPVFFAFVGECAGDTVGILGVPTYGARLARMEGVEDGASDGGDIARIDDAAPPGGCFRESETRVGVDGQLVYPRCRPEAEATIDRCL